MDPCARFRAAHAAGTPLSGEVATHARRCERCGVHSTAKEPDAATPSPSGDWSSLEARLDAERGARTWVRDRFTPTRGALIATTLILTLALVLTMVPRADFGVYPGYRMVGALGVLLASFLALVGAGWARETASERHQTAALAIGLLAPLLLAAAPAAHEAHEASLGGTGTELLAQAGSCFVWGALVALPTVVLGCLATRRPRADTLITAAVAGGVVGNLALQLHCPVTSPIHLALGHATVGLGLCAATLALRARAVGPLR